MESRFHPWDGTSWKAIAMVLQDPELLPGAEVTLDGLSVAWRRSPLEFPPIRAIFRILPVSGERWPSGLRRRFAKSL